MVSGGPEESEAPAGAGQEEFLRLTPDAALIVDSDGLIHAANEIAAAMFGYRPQQLCRQPLELLLPDRFRAVHEQLRRAYAAAPRTRPMGAGLELLGLRKDGSEFPVDISLSP